MNAGLLVFILLLALSFLGIPIYVALGIGTLVALNMADRCWCCRRSCLPA